MKICIGCDHGGFNLKEKVVEHLKEKGYSTQLLEFIDVSHTPKNLLIRAVKKKNFDQSESSTSSGYKEIANLVEQDICLAKLME